MNQWTESSRHLPHRMELCDCGCHVFVLHYDEECGYASILGDYHERGLWCRIKDAYTLLRHGEMCSASFIVADSAAARRLADAFSDIADRLDKHAQLH